ncbi:MAG TPA: hypothetical protein VF278_19615 [Pirellulales bacterium]
MRAIGSLLRGFGGVGTPPATPTLAITDNGDGTGATATITGSTVGSDNSIFVASWGPAGSNLAFINEANRIGDGTVTLSLTTGFYAAYCESLLGGVPAIPGNQPLFQVTNSAAFNSVHAALAAQVQTIIQGLLGTSIVGISPASVRVRKTAYMGDFSARNPLPSNFSYSLPGIVLCYFDVEEVADATNARDEIGYPITIVFAQESQSAATPSEANADQFLRWREAVERTFTHLRGCPNQLINVTANGLNYQFYDCRMTGGMIIDPDASTNKKLDIGWLKFSFRTWRGKNNT